MKAEVERLRELIQRDYEIHVWRSLYRAVLGWDSRTMHDHDSERLAKRFGFQLKPAPFLKKLQEFLDKAKPLESEE